MKFFLIQPYSVPHKSLNYNGIIDYPAFLAMQDTDVRCCGIKCYVERKECSLQFVVQNFVNGKKNLLSLTSLPGFWRRFFDQEQF